MSESQDQRTPEEIRAETEQPREELADTAAALAYKADVKARAHDRVEEVKADVRGKVDGVKSSVTGKVDDVKHGVHDRVDSVKEATPDSAGSAATSAKNAAGSAGATVKRNPVPTAAVAAVLIGFAIGYLVGQRRD